MVVEFQIKLSWKEMFDMVSKAANCIIHFSVNFVFSNFVIN
jgi:hypothetical protein